MTFTDVLGRESFEDRFCNIVRLAVGKHTYLPYGRKSQNEIQYPRLWTTVTNTHMLCTRIPHSLLATSSCTPCDSHMLCSCYPYKYPIHPTQVALSPFHLIISNNTIVVIRSNYADETQRQAWKWISVNKGAWRIEHYYIHLSQRSKKPVQRKQGISLDHKDRRRLTKHAPIPAPSSQPHSKQLEKMNRND